jgi:hypothetical protein
LSVIDVKLAKLGRVSLEQEIGLPGEPGAFLSLCWQGETPRIHVPLGRAGGAFAY